MTDEWMIDDVTQCNIRTRITAAAPLAPHRAAAELIITALSWNVYFKLRDIFFYEKSTL